MANPYWRKLTQDDLPPPNVSVLAGNLTDDGSWHWFVNEGHSAYWWSVRMNWEHWATHWSEIPDWMSRGPVNGEANRG